MDDGRVCVGWACGLETGLACGISKKKSRDLVSAAPFVLASLEKSLGLLTSVRRISCVQVSRRVLALVSLQQAEKLKTYIFYALS